jgi:hypothetical protein
VGRLRAYGNAIVPALAAEFIIAACMHDWPLILDIDRVPFGAWDRRIGQ